MGLYKQGDIETLFKSNQQLADSVYVLAKCIEAALALLDDADYRLVAGNGVGEPIPRDEVGDVFRKLTLVLRGHDPCPKGDEECEVIAY
jgi:hypothetical protein